MATADPVREPDQGGHRAVGRWLVPLAFVVVLAAALAVGLAVTDDEAAAPESTSPAAIEVDADSIYDFGTLGEMVAASDAIVVGTVVATEPGRLVGDPAAGGVISRLVTIEVDEALRGEIGATVVVEEEGTLPDGTPLIVNGVAPSEVGDHGIWFLDRLDDAELAVYLTINSQGRFLSLVDTDEEVLGGDRDDPLVQQLERRSLAELVADVKVELGAG